MENPRFLTKWAKYLIEVVLYFMLEIFFSPAHEWMRVLFQCRILQLFPRGAVMCNQKCNGFMKSSLMSYANLALISFFILNSDEISCTILHMTVATHHRNTYIIHLLESRVLRGILLGRGYGIKSLPKWLHQTVWVLWCFLCVSNM